MKGKNYILSIAIDKYLDISFNKLNNAKLDAKRIQNVLIEKYNFETILDSLTDNLAKRASIIDSLCHLSGFLTSNDNIIIYFAGHGQIHPKSNIGYWIPYDAAHNSTSNFINNTTVIDCIKAIDAKHILIISDSCFSGTFLLNSRGNDSSKHYAKLEEKKSRMLLASGREETVSDGEPGFGSPFANALINFLESNKEKYFSFSELAVKVAKATGGTVNQQPVWGHLSSFPNEGGEMVFKLKTHTGKSKNGWDAKFQEFCDARETRPEWPYISKENPDTKSLGIWCIEQRHFKRKKTLSQEREQKLHNAGFIFTPNIHKFFNGFGKFLAFMHNTGFDYIPNHLRTKYNEELAWLTLQQKSYRNNPCDSNNPKSYPQYRYDILKKNGIELNINRVEDAWPQFKIDLAKFYEKNEKFITIPSQVSSIIHIAALGNKLNDYMVAWKKNRLSDEKVKFISQYVDKDYQLNRDKRAFEKKLKEFREFQNGNSKKIPKQGKEDITKLGQWYAGIMTAIKPNRSKKLPAWKIARLREEKIIQ